MFMFRMRPDAEPCWLLPLGGPLEITGAGNLLLYNANHIYRGENKSSAPGHVTIHFSKFELAKRPLQDTGGLCRLGFRVAEERRFTISRQEYFSSPPP